MNLKKHMIMAGMSRAGTTFMYHNLQKHPQIFVPARKEIGYFAHHSNNDDKWYEAFYKDAENGQILADICGIYFTDDNALERILEYNSNAKVVLSIRNPKEWIYSFYEQYKSSFDVPPFREFLMGCSIKREGKEIVIDFTNLKISKTIQRYRDKFTDNLLIYDFDFFANDNLRTLKILEKFLGIDSYFSEGNYTDKKINARGRKSNNRFERMLQQKWFVDLILKLFPKDLILRLRANWEKNNAVQESKPKLTFSDEEKQMADEMFAI